jgi:uncharacterized protein YraI
MAHQLFAPKLVGLFLFLISLLLLSGCSLLFGGGSSDTPTPEPDNRVLVPTFTPTSETAAAPTEAPTTAPVANEQVAPAATEATSATEAPAATQPPAQEATPTDLPVPSPTSIPKAVVNAASANARGGPGTDFNLVGEVTQGQSFDVIGKNQEGTWWQFCCVNGQQAWIFGELVNVDNGASVPLAQNIPTPPPVAVAPPTQPPPTAPPAAPPDQPQATDTPAPPAGGAVNAGPCGGDDGCKFHIKGGPTCLANGGGELKMQLFFEHSGIDNGQPQGDYRLGLERDGQLIAPFADGKSIALSKNQGQSGPYNYEVKVGASSLPGGTLEGNYFFWVLDGNRERDSEVFTLYVPPGQGECWIDFDQAGH